MFLLKMHCDLKSSTIIVVIISCLSHQIGRCNAKMVLCKYLIITKLMICELSKSLSVKSLLYKSVYHFFFQIK